MHWQRAVLSIMAGSLIGCDSQSKPTPQGCPAPGALRIVPVQTIRVLDESDTVGSPTNKGCRLTNAQIAAYIDQADAFYRGTCNVGLAWDRNVYNLVQNLDDMNQFGCSARQRAIEFFWSFELQNTTFRSPNHINIYFHGNMRLRTGQSPCGDIQTNANTVDPKAEGELVPGTTVWKHILVNDRAETEPNASGRFISADRVLEHELAHWFLRQRSLPGEGGRYDANEHCNTCNVIMKRNPPHPGEFWEAPASGICERHEIWLKAASPDWNEE